ncbi:MAG: hypothetical protein CVV12_01240 [Gammaproteobacteria bacterium HGW-Gammaproteobacteria-2]|jgi:general secretion pathway protein B|nr:MAG: hypothetical protein CVV12_01240 [Gammaproteobacteria bacterium HGW-Gammaproteobacteria-2]
MSLILQALRKSEAQRQLGQAPSLLSPMPAMRATRSNGWRWAAFVLLLALVASVAWWLGQRGKYGEPTTLGDGGRAIAAQPDVRPDVRPQVPTTPALIESGAIATRAPVANVAKPAQPKPVQPKPTQPIATVAAIASPAIAVEPPTAPPAPAIVASEPELRVLADLPPSDRQNLPPLRITMHVFADQPTQRFAIIDGHRVGEGALLGDGVVLSEITRAGVILDLHGWRVLVPRP